MSICNWFRKKSKSQSILYKEPYITLQYKTEEFPYPGIPYTQEYCCPKCGGTTSDIKYVSSRHVFRIDAKEDEKAYSGDQYLGVLRHICHTCGYSGVDMRPLDAPETVRVTCLRYVYEVVYKNRTVSNDF